MSEENKNINDEAAYSFDGSFDEVGIERYIDEEPPRREKRKISLGAFLISAVALVLVTAMLTWTVAMGAYRGALADAIGGGLVQGEPVGDDIAANVDVINSLFETYSYYGLNDEELVSEVLRAYVAATGDPYAVYYTEEEFAAQEASAAGNTTGIGVTVTYTTLDYEGRNCQVIRVIAVVPDGPAYKAGIKTGDYIFYIGTDVNTRESIDSLGYDEAKNRILGEVGTVAELTILRQQDNGKLVELPFSITREVVKSLSVTSHICETDPSVGIVRISEFNLTTPKQFEEAVDALVAEGINKFVFDVRYNPGGSLVSIVAVLSFFFERGDVLLSTATRGGYGETIIVKPISEYEDEYAYCNVAKADIGKYKDLEIAVLCNENTASAAELFTAAFRDYGKGAIVGTLTYGKGSMQTVLPLDQFGVEGGLRFTTSVYFPPCGESYEGIGITPDVVVELSEKASMINFYELSDADDNQLAEAIKTFK